MAIAKFELGFSLMVSQYTFRNLLWHLLRGLVKSVPLAGEILFELLIAPLDNKTCEQQKTQLQMVLNELRGQKKTLKEIALFIDEKVNEKQIKLSHKNTEKIKNLIDVISAAYQGNEEKHDFFPNLRQAFEASVENAPLIAYLACLEIDVGLWRGLGIDRPVPIEAIFVSTALSKRNANERQTLSENDVFNALLNKQLPHRNILIEGGPGTGKSTLLRYWALKFAEHTSWALHLSPNTRKSIRVCIPIYLPLSFVELSCSSANNWSVPISDLVARRFLSAEDSVLQALTASIAQMINSGHAVIMLDGADEISTKRRLEMKNWIEVVCLTANGSPVVVTSRPTDFVDSLGGFYGYSMQPFSQDQQQLFIARWFGSIDQTEKADKMDRYLARPDMFLMSDQSVTGNPLFLTMMCIEFEVTSKLSRTPAELVDQFTKLLLHFLDQQKGLPPSRFSLDLKLLVLECLAQTFFESNRIKFFEAELFDCMQTARSRYSFDPGELLTEIESRSGLLVQNRFGYGEWQFSHLLFQEFFTARFWWRLHLEDKEPQKIAEWLQKKNYDERYEIVIKLFSQLTERER